LKHIDVTCAIIEKNGLVLATQRSAEMSMPEKWEFPGGKIESGESKQECLKRELIEELGISVHLLRELNSSIYDYPQFSITLYPFVCTIEPGEITLHEHASLVWLKPTELHTLDWAEADIAVLNCYIADIESKQIHKSRSSQ
jgi:8-oxo-dGTP diphosphatase